MTRSVQDLLEPQQLVHLAFHEAADRHARPLAHDLGDVFLVDLLLQHLLHGLQLGEMLGGLFDLALELGDNAVADLGGALEVALALEFASPLIELFLEAADRGDGFLLGLPVGDHRRLLLVEVGQLLLEGREALLAGGVGLLGQRDAFDLDLANAALDDVDLERHRVDFDPQLAGGFVNEVDGLVGQEPAGEVAVGEHGRADERRVLDAHPMVHLVALLQPAEDRDGVFDRRLIDVDGLEAPLERRVLLDVLAVLVERGGADEAELTAGQHRLDHVAGVHRALGRAGADDRVQLVDEGDDLALGIGDLLEHGLQPLLELAAVLRARDHRAEVERDQPLVLESFGHVAFDDPSSEALDDGGLADAGLADQHRVVLGAAGEHLDDPADLVVAADDRIELALTSGLGQIAAVLLERLELLLGVLARDAVAAPHLLQRGQEVFPVDVERLGEGEQEVLGGEVFVAHFRSGAVAAVERLLQLAGETNVGAVRLGQLGDRLVGRVAQGQRLLADPGEDGEHHAILLAQQRRQEVVRGDLRIGIGPRRLHRLRECLLRLDRPAVRVKRHRQKGSALREVDNLVVNFEASRSGGFVRRNLRGETSS